MGRSGSGHKAVMRPAPEHKQRMRLAPGGRDQVGGEDYSTVCQPRKAKIHRGNAPLCTDGSKKKNHSSTGTERNTLGAFSGRVSAVEWKEMVDWGSPAPGSDSLPPPSEAERLALIEWSGPCGSDGWFAWCTQQQQPVTLDSKNLRDNGMDYATPQRQWRAQPTGTCSPASPQGNTPSGGESTISSSAGPERRCPVLERLEYPVRFQAAAALAELARCKARAEIAAQAQRLEREARLKDEAAHREQRERLERAADELRNQLTSLQTGIDEHCALRNDLAAARREAAAAARELGACRTLLEIEQTAARLPAAEQHERKVVGTQEATARDVFNTAFAAGPKRAKKRRKARAEREVSTVAPPGASDPSRMSDEEVLNIWAIAHRIAEYVPVKFALLCSSMARISYAVTRQLHEYLAGTLEFCLRMQCQQVNEHLTEFGPPVVAAHEFRRFEFSLATRIRAGIEPIELRRALRRRVEMVQLIFREYTLRFEDLCAELRPIWLNTGYWSGNLLRVLRAQEVRLRVASAQ